ncbi:MAG: DNA polymerase IV [Alphaproteobacteria bacterium]|nr:DNA polymerase IV [Alphaproteobacteria bacterium]
MAVAGAKADTGWAMTEDGAPGFCRDCTAPVLSPAGRCGDCGSPRLIFHREIHSLVIAHVDCDAFYASVEKRDDPSLRDRPVIVGGGQRGVVSAACYIARIKGVHSAMPMFQARKLCPDAVVISPNMKKYSEVGRQIRTLMQAVTPLVEPVSIDEAFLDLSGTERLHNASPAATLIKLVQRIEAECGVTASVGLSYNKSLAKLASDIDKPRGFAILGRDDGPTFLADLPVNRIWGVGKALHRKLLADGISTIGQLRTRDEATLVRRYGSIGRRLYNFSRGEDQRRVNPSTTPKNVSAETTFFQDIGDLEELKQRLWPLCERLSGRLKTKELAGQTLVLKLKSSKFRTTTRSQGLAWPTQLAETIYQFAVPLLANAVNDAPAGSRFRLIGIGVATLKPASEADPPDLADPDLSQRKRVENIIDDVRDRMGSNAIARGRGLALPAQRKSPRKGDHRH